MISKIITRGQLHRVADDVIQSRRVSFVLSTSGRDRHGTVLNQDGWELKNYSKNPVVFYQHSLMGSPFKKPDPDMVIAKTKEMYFQGSGDQRKLIADAEFEPAEINPLAEKIFRKVLFGSLSSASVGFLEVGQGHYGRYDEAQFADNETYYFEGQELLEWSVVNIPSNPDAGKRALKKELNLALIYAKKELSDMSFAKLEKLSLRDMLMLIEANDMGIKDRDPQRVRAAIAELNQRQEYLIANYPVIYHRNPKTGEFERNTSGLNARQAMLLEKFPETFYMNFTTRKLEMVVRGLTPRRSDLMSLFPDSYRINPYTGEFERIK